MPRGCLQGRGGGAKYFSSGPKCPPSNLFGSNNPKITLTLIRTRQGSGEGVARGNSRPKGCFWKVRFFSPAQGFALKTSETLEFIEKIVLSILVFWTTVSPHDAFSALLAHPQLRPLTIGANKYFIT